MKSLNNVNFDGLRVINTSRNPSNGREGPMRIIDGKVRNSINSAPQTVATTFAFSSLSILLLGLY